MPDKIVTPLAFKVFEHAAALIARTPWEVSRDAELLFQAQAAAFRLYRHQPLIVAIDHYNLAPEACGGVLPYETTPEKIFRLRDYLASDRNRTGQPQ